MKSAVKAKFELAANKERQKVERTVFEFEVVRDKLRKRIIHCQLSISPHKRPCMS